MDIWVTGGVPGVTTGVTVDVVISGAAVVVPGLVVNIGGKVVVSTGGATCVLPTPEGVLPTPASVLPICTKAGFLSTEREKKGNK